MSKIVVIAPHPDDEVIGCGGSLIKHSRANNPITVITLGERLSSPRETDITAADYKEESANALRILGVTRHVCFNLPARDISITRSLVLRLTEELRRERPDIVYVPHEGESDAEHRQANRIAVEALWMAQSVYFEAHGPAMSSPQFVFGYEVWTPLARYAYVEDVTDVIDLKVQAMRAYASQLRHGPWDEAVRGLAAYRGVSTRGRGYAEVFAVLHTSGCR